MYVYANADHLVFNRITIRPIDAEFVSIYNPTPNSIDLSDYYITDGDLYYNLPYNIDFWSENYNDFIARFPEGLVIASNDSLVLGLHDSNRFFDYYRYSPDITLFEDMRNAVEGESTIGNINFGDNWSNQNMLGDDSEVLMLFKWDESSNIVQDVDYFLWGNTNNAIDKTGLDLDNDYTNDYFEDTAIQNQNPIDSHGEGFTYVRVSSSEGQEDTDDGNGITGHDETSENFIETWQIIESPDIIFGCMDESAANYNEAAAFDNGTCFDFTIQQVFNEYGYALDSEFCSNENNADWSQSVSTMGLIVNAEVTGGPKVITIRDENQYQLDVVIWDDWIWESDELSQYIDPYNPTQYSIVVNNGTLGIYQCGFQLEINDPSQIIFYAQNHPEGNYQANTEIIAAQLDIAPYVLIPSIGERIDFSYSFPSKSRVVIRVFDLSGRFITSLVDRYFEYPGTVFRHEDQSDWDGRDNLGQILSPGTYLMHIEAMNFQTGTTTSDIKPVVIGVKP